MARTFSLLSAAAVLVSMWGVAHAIEPAPPPDVDAPPHLADQASDAALPQTGANPGPVPANLSPVSRLVPRRGAPARLVPFQVQAWAFPGHRREVYVRDIRIDEIGNSGNSVAMHFAAPFTVQTLTLRTAHPQRMYEVRVRWADGSWFRDSYRLSYPSGRMVMIQSPNG